MYSIPDGATHFASVITSGEGKSVYRTDKGMHSFTDAVMVNHPNLSWRASRVRALHAMKATVMTILLPLAL